MLQQLREARKNESGFTLIELLIVIVILGVLAAIVVFSVQGITNRGSTSACKSDVATVTTAAEAYFAQNAAYPVAMSNMVPAFLHSVPTDVTYAAGPPMTVTGIPAGC